MSIEPVAQTPALNDPVAQLRLMLTQVDAHLPTLTGDMESLAQGREQLVKLRNDLATLVRTIEGMMIDAADGRKLTETSVGTVEIRRSMKRSNWQSDRLLRHLLVDAWGGDLDVSPGFLIDVLVEVIEDCLPITPSLGWRVTGLKEHKVDPGDWCLEEQGHKSVQVHGGDTK